MNTTFAERYISMKGENPDIATRLPENACTVIYNTLYLYMKKHESVFAELDKRAWTDFFIERIDEYEQGHGDYYTLRMVGHGNRIFSFALLDYLLHEIQKLQEEQGISIPSFAQELNDEFEKIRFGYRIINNHVSPITNAGEIEEIERATNEASDNVKEHFNRALQYLSDKANPDYRNSVKESLSAVEAFCYKYTDKNILTNSLNVLDKKGILHPMLKDLFSTFYSYASAKNTGSRHGWADYENSFAPTYYEAKYIFVSCASFINYLKGKFSDKLNLSR